MYQLFNRSLMGVRTIPHINVPLTEVETVSMLTVTDNDPFHIVHVSQEWLDWFRFSKEEIFGRSLCVIYGPNTDTHLLQDMIKSTPEGKQRAAVVTLYSSAGKENVMIVKAIKQNGCCTLTMTLSDAILAQHASTKVENSRIVVASHEPYTVQQISPTFSTMFGFCEEEIVGRNIRMLHGPHTDILAFKQLLSKAEAGFSQRGTTIAFTKDCVDFVCTVELVPVIGQGGTISQLQIDFTRPQNQSQPTTADQWQSGITATPTDKPSTRQFMYNQADSLSQLPTVHIGAPCQEQSCVQPAAHTLNQPETMRSSPPSSTLSFPVGHTISSAHSMFDDSTQHVTSCVHSSATPSTQSTELPASAPTVMSHSFGADVFEGAAMHAAGDQHSDTSGAVQPARASESTSGVGQRGGKGVRSSLRLFPRRKPAAGETDPKSLGGPVDLSKEVVDKFVGMSMKEAAYKLGISASAMKKACRKLGVKKWPHKSIKGSVDVGPYNSEYVRLLYAKYSEADKLASEAASSKDHPCIHLHGHGLSHCASDVSEGSDAASDSSARQTPVPGCAQEPQFATPSLVWDPAWQPTWTPMQCGSAKVQHGAV